MRSYYLTTTLFPLLFFLACKNTPHPPTDTLTEATPTELLFETTENGEGLRTETKAVTIANVGDSLLHIEAVALTGPAADRYSFEGPAEQALPAGAAQEYSVSFSGGGDLGYREAALSIKTNNGQNGTITIKLHGLHKAGYEGDEEPPLHDVVKTLGIGIDAGWRGLKSEMDAKLQGGEMAVPLFKAAGEEAVTITPVGRYSPAERLPFGYYTRDEDGTLTHREVAVLAGGLAQAQTLFPELESGTDNFTAPEGPFGIYVASESFGRNSYTQDELNEAATNGAYHRARIYPLRDRAGAEVPNSFLVTFEDANNGDYQDYLFIVRNVSPANKQ